MLVMYPDRGYFFDVEQGVDFYSHSTQGELLVFPKCGHNIFEHYPQMYAYGKWRTSSDVTGDRVPACRLTS
jgi:hypothetical protein